MSKKKTNKQKPPLLSCDSKTRGAGTKFVRPMRQFVEVQMMHIDVNETMQIKEDSP
jgi:hypothetical protein